MASTRKTRICLLTTIVAAVVTSISNITNASPLPGSSFNNPVVHSLATYATTNSFLYTNKLGTVDYRFTKPQLSQLQTFTKLVGIPFQPRFFSSTGQIYISPNPSKVNEEIPLQNHVTNGEPQYIPNSFLTPPELGTRVTSFTEVVNQNEIVQNLNKNINAPFQENLGSTAEENLNGDSLSGINNPSIQHDESANVNNLISSKSSTEDKNATNRQYFKSELENLYTKVINAPFHKPGSLNINPDSSNNIPAEDLQSNSPDTDETPIQSRQDSNLEQPLSFFPSGTAKLSPPPQGIHTQSDPRLQFPPLLSGNHRFAIPTTPQQTGQSPSLLSRVPPFQSPELYQENNRFHTQQNPISPQLPILNAHAQPQFLPGSNTAIPSGPGVSSQHQFSPPTQPHLQYPRINGPPGGAPPPEPENGFNPFHLQEQFPESPYESEFSNDPPEDRDSIEQSQRSGGTNNVSIPKPLDFAQSTLRSVKTEEILEVVKRKPVPSECVYNTVSYGGNGEDCVEAKKKK